MGIDFAEYKTENRSWEIDLWLLILRVSFYGITNAELIWILYLPSESSKSNKSSIPFSRKLKSSEHVIMNLRYTANSLSTTPEGWQIVLLIWLSVINKVFGLLLILRCDFVFSPLRREIWVTLLLEDRLLMFQGWH